MDNITYKIFEPAQKDDSSNSKWYDIPLIHKNLSIKAINTDDVSIIDPECESFNDKCARALDYDLNYTIKYLAAILEFYGSKKGKLKKRDIIIKIIEFESDPDNILLFENRKRLFENFIELKNNPFFKKLILKGFT